ncbi:SRPBCC family protein [Jeongeupia naejangsanensis]|uniref:SRPBCC domain-containing protein n=1 Tax=Jeongeupia naejangsanensis TaxID=613195 RepID=A0ABS2BIT1_9NEIS|nr:SRPBCC domain-containing protein [Jeongeupia naejangsanensis]MBM3114891.1 SRPBCC domain-containing protein [Jeongeupia naejangsanensis]
MNDYNQSLVLAAMPADVYAALTTSAGLRGWWTVDSDADPADTVGSELRFRFGSHYMHMRIEQLTPSAEVHWYCTAAFTDVDAFTRKDEWVGTRIKFRLAATGDGQTRLDFVHLGLVPEFECYDLCQNGWQHFLTSLQQYVATGTGTPYRPAEPHPAVPIAA